MQAKQSIFTGKSAEKQRKRIGFPLNAIARTSEGCVFGKIRQKKIAVQENCSDTGSFKISDADDMERVFLAHIIPIGWESPGLLYGSLNGSRRGVIWVFLPKNSAHQGLSLIHI